MSGNIEALLDQAESRIKVLEAEIHHLRQTNGELKNQIQEAKKALGVEIDADRFKRMIPPPSRSFTPLTEIMAAHDKQKSL